MTRTVLVTGASSGIGEATARRLAADGWEVHALARRAERLEALAAETGATVHVADVTDTELIEELIPWIEVDALVSNAGIGSGIEGLLTASATDVERAVSTNVTATLQLIRLALPGMQERGRGHIVNIGSTAGIHVYASALYGATKAAVRMLSRDLRLELRGSGIRVSEICPGRVATEFYDTALPDPERRALVKATGIRELRPEDVADAIAYALGAPEHVNVSTIELQPLEQTFGGTSFDPLDR